MDWPFFKLGVGIWALRFIFELQFELIGLETDELARIGSHIAPEMGEKSNRQDSLDIDLKLIRFYPEMK